MTRALGLCPSGLVGLLSFLLDKALKMVYIFADEAGNLDFSPRGSRYFLVTAVTMRNWIAGVQLLDLRHTLAAQGAELLDIGFHAAEDKQYVRDFVYQLVQRIPLDIDAVVLDKRKTQPHIAANEGYFYQLAWHLLFKYMAPRRFTINDDVFLVGSSLGTKAKKIRFGNALASVVRQHVVCRSYTTAFWTTASHPCLQIADYCAWAIQRWKERGDNRSYVLIQGQVQSCFEPFLLSNVLYY